MAAIRTAANPKPVFYPVSQLFPQADDLTGYARTLGYRGCRRVLVLDGKVISHRSLDWFEFCQMLRQRQKASRHH